MWRRWLARLHGVQEVVSSSLTTPTMKMYYVYILQSQKDGNYYIGCTSNISRRLKQHNLGNVKSTKPRSPLNLIYKEEFEDKSDAYKREFCLKSPRGYQDKIQLVKRYWWIARPEGDPLGLAWGARGREFKSHHPDHLR